MRVEQAVLNKTSKIVVSEKSIFIIENQLEDEREIFHIDEHRNYFGRYEKWETGNLVKDGKYEKINTEMDSIWIISPISLEEEVIITPIYESVKHCQALVPFVFRCSAPVNPEFVRRPCR